MPTRIAASNGNDEKGSPHGWHRGGPPSVAASPLHLISSPRWKQGAAGLEAQNGVVARDSGRSERLEAGREGPARMYLLRLLARSAPQDR